MGDVVSRPSPERLQELKDCLPATLSAAAAVIGSADVLILATGAGWSADSGLAVYKDVADVPAYREVGLEYHDICQPHWIDQHPPLFYGFWGMCFNDYQTHEPHEGYRIIRRWKEQRFSCNNNGEVENRNSSGSPSTTTSANSSACTRSAGFFCVTSNVDGHFRRAGFSESELREIHGSVDVWQCSHGPACCYRMQQRSEEYIPSDDSFASPSSASSHGTGMPYVDGRTGDSPAEADQGIPELWHRPEGYMFNVDETSKMAVLGSPAQDVSDEVPLEDAAIRSFKGRNHPVCPACGARARPAILMFGDGNWIDDDDQERRFKEFTTSLLQRAYASGHNSKVKAPEDDEGHEQQPNHPHETIVLDNVGKRRRVDQVTGKDCPHSPGSPRDLINPPLRVVVLEIGCGDRVPTIRRMTEDMVAEVTAAGSVATLVRINPDFPDADRSDLVRRCIPVASRGLAAVRAIDGLLASIPTKTAATAAAVDASIRAEILAFGRNATALLPRMTAMRPCSHKSFQHPAFDEEEDKEQAEEDEEQAAYERYDTLENPHEDGQGLEQDEDIGDLPIPMSLGSNADAGHWQELERQLMDSVASQSISPRPSLTDCNKGSRRSSLNEDAKSNGGCRAIRSG